MKFRTKTASMLNVQAALNRTEKWETRPLKFWASGLPFCPRAFWLDHRVGPLTQRTSYANEVALPRGTAIHTCFQKWLGKTGVLYGNWECLECARLNHPYVLRDKLGPPTLCPWDRTELVYQELRLTCGDLVARPDGLVAVKEGFNLLELKSINSMGLRNLKEPKPPHVEQANCCACLLRLEGYPVQKAWIWYVSADRPQREFKIFEFEPSEPRFQRLLQNIEDIKQRLRETQPPKRSCSSRDERFWCPASSWCWSTNLATLLKETDNATN